jgi:hypothetical protein
LLELQLPSEHMSDRLEQPAAAHERAPVMLTRRIEAVGAEGADLSCFAEPRNTRQGAADDRHRLGQARAAGQR